VVTDHVIKEGILRPAGFRGVRQTVDVESEPIHGDGVNTFVSPGLRIGFHGKEPADEYAQQDSGSRMRVFHYGERLRSPATLAPTRNFRNPGAFDYRTYLAGNGLAPFPTAQLLLRSCSWRRAWASKLSAWARVISSISAALPCACALHREGSKPAELPRTTTRWSCCLPTRIPGFCWKGDAEKAVEQTRATEGPRAQLLKAAHNGSLTSTTPEPPGAVQPSFAFISVGARTHFGHPRIETPARLEQSGVKAYR
jgi:hypothetical protein